MTLTNDFSCPVKQGAVNSELAAQPFSTSGRTGTPDGFSSSFHRPALTLGMRPLGSDPQAVPLVGTRCMIRPNVSLAKLTSFRVGGPAEFFVAPQSLNDIQASLDWANRHSVPVTLIGAGSNLLVSDRGIEGLVICTRHLKHTLIDADTAQITASAGGSLARLAWQAAEQGWRGLEWAVGIPGTVGGAVVMNAGAHQSCTADILMKAHVLSTAGDLQEFSPQNLNFGYRTSILQASDLLLTQATFQLQPGFDPKEVIADTRQLLKQRHSTQPYHLPSCGSVFRNPGPQAAGWLIEQTGLKGYQIGDAQVAHRHANFILNLGHASASDILGVIHHVQQQVEHHWSLLLHPEVKCIGEF